ncbi:peptidoglycan recognition protein family protein [Massilia sp. DD77]|uniref:peptidoglycan recognition protein family protein n=1 Tax=Massilia sp. DD77 TaxID=3109349 RepID=UPI002FFFFA50
MKNMFRGLVASLCFATSIQPALASTDYPPAIWNPAASCNYSARTASVSHVTVHTTQGSYAGSISWFQNCSAGVSAHYVIRSSDGQVTQMVREADKAWHVGNSNGYTVGIEHEGYVANPSAWYTTAMYNASSALTRDILASRSLSQKVYDGSAGWNAVPSDSLYNVKGHVNYASQSHTDPGSGWDWPRYKSLVAGGGGSTTTWPLVQYGNTGERVRTIQYLLQQWGYALTVNASFDSATQNAVKNFQSSHGLGADGIVGNATWPVLVILTQQGDSGAKVRAVQSQLNESGAGIAVDGAFGPATATAVRNFQTSKGLSADGVVGDNTWNKMAW